MKHKRKIKKSKVKKIKRNRRMKKRLELKPQTMLYFPDPPQCDICGYTAWCIHNWEKIILKKDLTKA